MVSYEEVFMTYSSQDVRLSTYDCLVDLVIICTIRNSDI
jgi:hypothetical protein